MMVCSQPNGPDRHDVVKHQPGFFYDDPIDDELQHLCPCGIFVSSVRVA